MSGEEQGRYSIARQSYAAHGDAQGRMTSLDLATVMLHEDIDDAEEAAQICVDLALEDPGILFVVRDRESEGHVSIHSNGEPREELLEQARQALDRFGQDTPLHDAQVNG